MDTEQRPEDKYERLKACFEGLPGVAVAFSGGVDSTLLLKAAHDVLGRQAVAVTAGACFVPSRELMEAEDFCRKEGIRHFICEIDPFEIEGFSDNPPNRCYLCKKEIFKKLIQTAKAQGICHIAEGSNLDDEGDYRPGMQAVAESGVRSPLREARLTKSDIRLISRQLGLPTWDKPSFACLASRFVYGERITKEKLSMVDQAEQLLLDLGFRQFRVRVHGDMARLEILPEQFPRLLEERIRQDVTEKLKRLGFTYAAMDLAGYRSGSMNEGLV